MKKNKKRMISLCMTAVMASLVVLPANVSKADSGIVNLGTTFGNPVGEDMEYANYKGVLEVANVQNGETVGPTLTYHKDSEVAILQETSTGFYFKDMNGNGKLDPYEDWRLSTDERAEWLASEMPTEKRLMLMVHGVGTTEQELKDGRRWRWGTMVSGRPEVMAEGNNQLQMWAEKDIEGFGVPVITPTDPRHTGTIDTGNPDWDGTGSGFSGWPNHIGLAGTFSEEAIYDYSRITALEYRAVGLQMQIAPMIDTITDPRWSRAGGCFSEDFTLNEDLNRAQIKGIQTSDETIPNWGIDQGWGMTSVASMAKHWPGGGNGEFGFDAHTDSGKFGVFPNMDFEDFMATFARAAGFLKEDKGTTQQSAAFMPYFTISLDQDPSGLNVGNGLSNYMIQQKLRDVYDYDGFGVTDWMIHSQNGHGYESAKGYDDTFRAWQILNAGMDQIGGVINTAAAGTLMDNTYNKGVEEIGKEAVDEMTYTSAKRCFRIMMNLGLFENAYTDPDYAKEFCGSRELQEAAQEGHVSSAAMIKNKNNLLPLEGDGVTKPTVFIPLNASNNALVNLTIAERYFDIPEEITTAVAERRALTLLETQSAVEKSDFALIKLTSPTPANGPTNSAAQNLMYSPYTAQWQREISLGYDWVKADGSYVRTGAGEVPDILNGDQKSNRSVYNGTTHPGVPASLSIINNTVAAMGDKPIVFALGMTNPMVVSDFEPYCDAIIVGGGSSFSDNAILDIVSGAYEPNGLLSVNLPMNMETVELAYEDTDHDMVPYIDSEGSRYTFGYGLNWSGRINDARTAKYVKEREYPLAEKRGLEDYIGRALKLDLADYDASTRMNISSALTIANAVNIDKNATQERINNAAEALRSIIRSLPEIKIDVVSSLADAANGTIRVNASAVTFTPRNTIVVTLSDGDDNTLAVAAADDNGNARLDTGNLAPGTYVITAKSGEFTGSTELLAEANKNSLQTFIDYAEEQMQLNDYYLVTQSVRDRLETALTKAKEVMGDVTASQEQVNETALELLKWIHALDLREGDKSLLSSAVDMAETIDLSNYVAQGQARFRRALERANEVMDAAFISQDEIDEAADELYAAMLALRYKAETKVLNNLLQQAKVLSARTDVYKAESLDALTAAIKSAESVLNADLPDSEQAVVDKAFNDLLDAINKLALHDSSCACKPVTTTPSVTTPTVTSPSVTNPQTAKKKVTQLAKAKGLKLTANKAKWKKVKNNSGYTLKLKQGKKVVRTVQLKKNATSYKIPKKLLKKGKKYKVTLVAKGTGNYKNSKAAKSNTIKK